MDSHTATTQQAPYIVHIVNCATALEQCIGTLYAETGYAKAGPEKTTDTPSATTAETMPDKPQIITLIDAATEISHDQFEQIATPDKHKLAAFESTNKPPLTTTIYAITAATPSPPEHADTPASTSAPEKTPRALPVSALTHTQFVSLCLNSEACITW